MSARRSTARLISAVFRRCIFFFLAGNLCAAIGQIAWLKADSSLQFSVFSDWSARMEVTAETAAIASVHAGAYVHVRCICADTFAQSRLN